ncbi:motility associated factor glycosyltransferase family protein, partial [Campylobacter lari]|uniref:motility associated factor glycosyltransferase family protein n=1 Tax=Campylobacter lari TaxID=201 RepID=UPI0037271503
FNKNLNSLKNENLKNKLKNLKVNKFRVSIGSDPLDINFISNDKITKSKLYEHSLVQLNEKLNLYNDKYFLYPVFYFFGFGNGILYKALLQNKNHQKIVVFECELEFIYLSFHFVDFSKELNDDALIILDIKELNELDFQILCSNDPFFHFLRVYFLDIHCDYYEKYHDEILNTNENMQKHIKQIILLHGNDSKDALIGIENHLYNLYDLISNFSLSKLITKREKACKNAIIVSTGPSLTKQLPLLKQYANHASIFCADGSYPILAKEGIKPDYVFSLERIEKTSEFFNNDFGKFDKDILFILMSVTHPNTIKYLKQNNRKFIITQRLLPFVKFLNLNSNGYISGCPSVANMAYFIAVLLKHENIIFIGQDLAYAKDGSSHPKDYHYSSTCDTYRRTHINTLAYGGKEQIKTHEVWNVFRVELEKKITFVRDNFNITTYNATEGGARIEGTIEKPFKELCEKLLTKNIKKPFTKLHPLKKDQREKLMLQAYKRIKEHIKNSQKFLKECKKLYKALNQKSKTRYTLNELNAQIDDLKQLLESNKFIFLREVVSPSLFHLESTFSKIYVHAKHNESDKQNKLVAWIEAHKAWVEDISELVNIQEKALKIAIIPLQDILEKKN